MDAILPDREQFSIGDAEDALEALSRHAGDCIKLIDLDGRVVRWNAACEDLYGWSADEVIGRTLPHIPPELRLRVLSDIRRVSAAGLITERESEVQRADGTRVAMRITLIPVRDDEGHAAGVLTTSRELSSDRRMERQRDEFLAFVGRRLRDPLSAVLGSAQLLARPEIMADSERRESAVASLTRQAQDAAMLVEDLLVVSELSDGTLVLAPQPVDVGRLVADVVESSAIADDVYVEFDPLMDAVRVDPRRLTQAIAALVENAAHRATCPGAVSVSVFRSGDDAVIEVSDDGPCPTATEHDRVMERVVAEHEDDGGTPLADAIGLYLARYVAEAHGGGLSLSALKDGGAVYSLFVPMHLAAPEGGDR